MLAARLPGALPRPDALAHRAHLTNSRRAHQPAARGPDMTETPSPEDKTPETATTPAPAASEGNGDPTPAPVTEEQATAEAAIAPDAPALDAGESGEPIGAVTPSAAGPSAEPVPAADETPTLETPAIS